MKRKKLAFLILLSAFLGACRPGGRTPASGQDDRIPSAESIIARMRADTLWIKHLETLADSAVGPGARCIDPVWHLFEWEGRNWFFNQDWGGVLEIPTDFLPEDDYLQAHFSFHGTSACSPDSLVLITFYAGCRSFFVRELIEMRRASLAESGFRILSCTERDSAFTIRAQSDQGIIYYGRTLVDAEADAEYSVSLQYPVGYDVRDILPMIDRYPQGPGDAAIPAP